MRGRGRPPPRKRCPTASWRPGPGRRDCANSTHVVPIAGQIAWYDVVRALYPVVMTSAKSQPTDISVRQFVADSGSVTRGLRQGRTYTLTLNGEPLARMIPIVRRQAVPKQEALAIFATAPVIDAAELRADLDAAIAQDLRDPYQATGR